MSVFLSTLIAVSALLLTAAPGYLFIKKKMVGEQFIADLSKLLLYVCQSALVIYTFAGTEFSQGKLLSLGNGNVSVLGQGNVCAYTCVYNLFNLLNLFIA